MRIYCTECGGKALIRKRNKLSVEFAKIYCICPDPLCAHSFAMDLTFSHTLRPSAKVVDRLLFDRLREMPKVKQRELFEQLGAQA